MTLVETAGLFDVVDKLGDGVVQLADFVIKSSDFVVLAMPEIAGLPFVITGLVMAGGLAAALSTADGLLLTIANAISHDLYYKIDRPEGAADPPAHHHQDPPHRHRAGRGDRGDRPAGDHRGAGGGPSASPQRPSSRPGDGHLVEASQPTGSGGRNGGRPGNHAPAHGRLALLRNELVGHQTVASGSSDPAGLSHHLGGLLLTAPPPERVQELVSSVRYPKATVSSAEFRPLAEATAA